MVVECLLRAGATLELAKESSGATALIASAGKGHAQIVQLLLHEGASVDAATHRGGTAAFVAAQGGHTEALAVVLAAGAKPDVRASGDATALFVAAQNGHESTVAQLLAVGAAVDAADEVGIDESDTVILHCHVLFLYRIWIPYIKHNMVTKNNTTALV